MPVKIYVSQDSQGRPNPANHAHEIQTGLDIIKRLWLAFHHQPTLYAIVANLHAPCADMVIISERGIGLLELKHYHGCISQKPGHIWYAGPKPIQAGAENQGYRNPHEQAQAYTNQLRDKLINAPVRDEPWLPGANNDWQKFKFSTAVCFTHPEALIDDFKQELGTGRGVNVKDWELFTLLRPEETPEWAAALTFEAELKEAGHFAPVRLRPPQIIRIVTQLLKGVEWTEITNLMPTGRPYAYLNLIENQIYTMTFGLDQDKMIIGRDPKTCHISLPERLKRVSREHHVIITRDVEGIYIEDANSRNGTYSNGYRLDKKLRLKPGQQIMLGGPTPGNNACLLEFSLKPKALGATTLADE